MRLSDKELKIIHDKLANIPFLNMTDENVDVLQSIIKELINLRNQVKENSKEELESLLPHATEYNKHLEQITDVQGKELL